MFAALVLGARTLPEVIAGSGLAAGEAAAALQKLVSGGMVTTDAGREHYEAVEDVFKAAMRTERRVSAVGGDGAGAYFRRGRLLALPTEATVRARVLGVVVEAFDPDHVYSEARVNALCAEWHDDWVSLRRALVDEGLILRDRGGTGYRR
ncbi:hypothetical protein GCM10027436_83240 [Actinophytocola sediminis]